MNFSYIYFLCILYAGGDNINSYLAAVITAIIRLVFSTLASFLLLRISRRYLGIFSALGSAFASFALAIYMSIKEDFIDVSYFIVKRMIYKHIYKYIIYISLISKNNR